MSSLASAEAAENPLAYRSPEPPVLETSGRPNALARLLLLPVSFYSRILSRLDGDRCPSYPSCSLYARKAVRRYGPALGLWMTVDRLIHERTTIRRGRLVRLKDGALRVADPLEENVFWLRDRRRSACREKEIEQ